MYFYLDAERNVIATENAVENMQTVDEYFDEKRKELLSMTKNLHDACREELIAYANGLAIDIARITDEMLTVRDEMREIRL